jgi:hypothetical protein
MTLTRRAEKISRNLLYTISALVPIAVAAKNIYDSIVDQSDPETKTKDTFAMVSDFVAMSLSMCQAYFLVSQITLLSFKTLYKEFRNTDTNKEWDNFLHKEQFTKADYLDLVESLFPDFKIDESETRENLLKLQKLINQRRQSSNIDVERQELNPSAQKEKLISILKTLFEEKKLLIAKFGLHGSGTQSLDSISTSFALVAGKEFYKTYNGLLTAQQILLIWSNEKTRDLNLIDIQIANLIEVLNLYKTENPSIELLNEINPDYLNENDIKNSFENKVCCFSKPRCLTNNFFGSTATYLAPYALLTLIGYISSIPEINLFLHNGGKDIASVCFTTRGVIAGFSTIPATLYKDKINDHNQKNKQQADQKLEMSCIQKIIHLPSRLSSPEMLNTLNILNYLPGANFSLSMARIARNHSAMNTATGLECLASVMAVLNIWLNLLGQNATIEKNKCEQNDFEEQQNLITGLTSACQVKSSKLENNQKVV